MSDLISRSALKQALRKCQIESLIAHNEEKNVFDVINDQPTAYDVEKVVTELEEEKGKFKGIYTDYAEGLVDAYEHAISVVKAGGVE